MQRPHAAAILMIILFLAPIPLFAQWDTGAPNATLRVNGQLPSIADPVSHDVNILVPGNVMLTIESGANPWAGIILINGPIDPPATPGGGGVYALPWGGSLDIGTPDPLGGAPAGLSLLLDGIGYSVGPLDAFAHTDAGDPQGGVAPAFAIGGAVTTAPSTPLGGWQAVVSDPTVPTWGLDTTQAADIVLGQGQSTLVNLSDDSVATVGFLPGYVFNFHGNTYTEISIVSNGFVTFGAPTTTFQLGFSIDTVDWLNQQPSIAAFIADWNPDSMMPGDGVLYTEFLGQTSVTWGDPSTSTAGGMSHWSDSDLNRFSIGLELDNGSNPHGSGFQISWPLLSFATQHQPGSGVTGHTPGGTALQVSPTDTGLDFPQVAAVGQAQIEEHNVAGNNYSAVGWDGAGTPRALNEIRHWNNRSLAFVPNPYTAIPGDQGYAAIPAGNTTSMALDVSPSTLNMAGGEVITITGKFMAFDPFGTGSGTVTFDPSGANLQGTIIGILDGSNASGLLSLPHDPSAGPHRNGEALQVTTPAFPGAGSMDIEIDFPDGTTVTLPVNIISPSVTSTPVSQGDDTFATHTLTTTSVSFGGIARTELHIASNGFVAFEFASGDWTPTLVEHFAGFSSPQSIPNPGVAVLWSDLNRNPTTNGATYVVVENALTGETTVQFNNMNYWTSIEPAGSFSVTFNTGGVPGWISFDHSNAIHGPTNTDAVLFGITDGDSTTGTDTVLDLVSAISGGYTSFNGPNSFAQIFAGGQPWHLDSLSSGGKWNALDLGNGTTVPYYTWTLFP